MDSIQICWTVEEAARAIGVSRSKMYSEIAAGSIAVVRIGRSVRVRVADVEAFVEQRLTQPEPSPAALLRW